MATATIYTANDGFVTCNSLTYATAADGGGTLLGDTTGASVRVGQNLFGGDSNYYINEGFISFDLSTLPAGVIITDVQLTVHYQTFGGGGVRSNLEFREYNYGTLATSDFRSRAQFGALPLYGSMDTTGKFTFTDYNVVLNGTILFDAVVATYSVAGIVSMAVSTLEHRTGDVPTVDESHYFYVSEFGPPEAARLVISYDDPTPSTDEFLNPIQDIVVGGWTTQAGSGSGLYGMIDEVIADDADYIQSPAGPISSQYYETKLEFPEDDPSVNTGHIVHYRYKKNVAGGNIDLVAELLEGTPGELLAVNTQGIETSATGWQSVANCTLTRSLVQARTGVASLSMKVNATGDARANLFTREAAVSGLDYIASGWVKAAATARDIQISIEWLDEGINSLGEDISTAVMDSTSTWTAITVTATAPPGTFWADVSLWVRASILNEVHYFDDLSLLAPFTTIDFWTHTNIPNTWTQQNQTLSGAEADSITDYSDLRLRFTPDMVTTDAVVPIPTKVADRASANSNSAVTTVDLVLASMTVGNYLIIRSAADNSGGGGAARSFTLSNQSGTPIDTATDQTFQQNNDPGAASAGVTCNVGIAKITATSGTVRITYSGSVVQSCVAEEWSGIHATTPIVGSPIGANGVNSTNMASVTDASIAAGNVAYAAEAIEGPSTDVYTQDADTTNGSWVGVTKLGTTNVTADTNMTVYGGYKTVTAAGAQTYNPTITATARDSAGLILELAAAPIPSPTIKAQVSWANLEIPVAAVVEHSLGINVGLGLFSAARVTVGAMDS